jgi:predicted AAA+ superfamily ATPase
VNSSKRPNQDALYQALNIYRDAMRPFIFRNLKTVQGLTPKDRFQNEADIDVGDFPYLFREYWHDVFKYLFDPDRDVRSAVGIITEARNKVAHPESEDMELGYALARLHEIADILGQINTPEQKRGVEVIRDKLLTNTAPTAETKPKLPRRKVTDLKSWRDVIRPNTDVIEGSFRKSEFAADLQEVFEGKAKTSEYGETDIFFNQTYITPGLRQLLVNTLKRLGGKDGDPVIQLKTGFGGGKTHSLIALYHLVTGINILKELPADGEYKRLREEIEDILEEADWDHNTPLNANVSVLVGTYLSTTDADETKQGDPLNTLWGMMADQLGGQDAYNIIGKAAREGSAPGGNQLDRLFEHVGPSVILIDELVAYARNVQNVTRESIYTFFQAVTESVNRSKNVTLVATLPEGQVQAGGEGGMTVLDTLESILERVDAVSIPLEVDNAFEVVRRRLFGSIIDETERDLTCEAFRKMYQNSRSEYPSNVSDQDYLKRMKDCYPIHPEIFDRLFQDWSAIPGFQRTRGVLRIMATGISRLYQEQDPSLLIMPANLTLDDPALADEFTRLLARSGGNWDPVVKEVDSHGSRTDQIDRNSQSFIEVGSAARRIARTIFLGSASSHAVKGISQQQIHLGVVEPGQGVSVYNDALSRMTGNLYFLYNLDDRYYFHTQENLNKVSIDRAAEYTEEDIYTEIVSRLERTVQSTSNVKVCPISPSLVKDSETIQYVILHPQASLPSREKEVDTARDTALKILTYSADDERQRTFRNTLLFIAARRDDIRDLKNLVKNYLAWNSIMSGDDLHSALSNLTGARLDQTKENLESAEDAATAALFKAYRWALAPTQADPQKDNYDFSVTDTKPEDGRIVQRIREKFTDDDAIVTKIAPEIYAGRLQQYVWSSDVYQDHIEIERLWELMAQNVYMPRLRDRGVLAACIRDGITAGVFGYASAYQDGDYRNFRFEEQIGGLRIVEDSTAVLINPEFAKLLKEEEEKRKKSDDSEPCSGKEKETEDDSNGPVIEPPKPKGPTRVVVTKALQLELPFVEDIDIIQDEIARTLQADGGTVKIEITVTADKSDGFSENTTRAVRQNSEHLNAEFKSD